MDDFDPDEILESLFGEHTDGPQPKYHATYRNKRLTVVPFLPSMIGIDPARGWSQKAREARNRDRQPDRTRKREAGRALDRLSPRRAKPAGGRARDHLTRLPKVPAITERRSGSGRIRFFVDDPASD